MDIDTVIAELKKEWESITIRISGNKYGIEASRLSLPKEIDRQSLSIEDGVIYSQNVIGKYADSPQAALENFRSKVQGHKGLSHGQEV